MDQNKLRKLAGLPPVMEATVPTSQHEREFEKITEKFEKVDANYKVFKTSLGEFREFLKSPHFGTEDVQRLVEEILLDRCDEALDGLHVVELAIGACDAELEHHANNIMYGEQ